MILGNDRCGDVNVEDRIAPLRSPNNNMGQSLNATAPYCILKNYRQCRLVVMTYCYRSQPDLFILNTATESFIICFQALFVPFEPIR